MHIILSNLMQIITKISGNSFSSANFFWNFLGVFFKNIGSIIWNFLLKIFWSILTFVLGIMEAFEYMIKQFLGIDSSVTEYLDYARTMSSGGLNFLDYLVKVFRAVFIVGVLLVIIFTIFAIIKQEWVNASSGYEAGSSGVGNNKKGIVLRMFKSIAVMLFVPLIMMFILVGVNSILSSFSRALEGTTESSIAAKILASSSYDANKYRKYANENKRIPIIIEAYDADDYDVDEMDKYIDKIKSIPVQKSLLNIALSMENGNLQSFADTLVFESPNSNVSSKVSNTSDYTYRYETFICTPEQYQVMADFVDYAQEANLNYYIKSIDENDIDWQYVNDVVFDQNNNTLVINYVDASDLNKNNDQEDTYQIVYSMSYNVTTPISDALKTMMALLGIGDYGDNTYNVLERDEEFTNVVDWSTEKVLLKLSENFKINDMSTWTCTDQIIIYEYNHFKYNNTLNNYTIDDLINGVELDAREMKYVEYDPVTGLYKRENVEPCVVINGKFYRTEKSKTERDSFGNLYYVLKGYEDVDYFSKEYKVITKDTSYSANLKMSNGFDINKPSTWTYSDQLLVYEYYRDLSYRNSFGRTVGSFENLCKGNGVQVPRYQVEQYSINENGESKRTSIGYYVLINDTFYAIENTTLSSPSGEKFLANVNEGVYYTYSYSNIYLTDASRGELGITNLSGIVRTSIGSVQNLPADSKYGDFVLKFSNNFDYQNPATWTYRDYALFYIYLRYLYYTCDLDSIKSVGVNGKLILSGGTVYLQFNYKASDTATSESTAYINISTMSKVSELNFYYMIDLESTLLGNNIDLYGEDLFIYRGENDVGESDTLISSKVLNFSDSYSESDLDTWTMADFLLFAFSSMGIIDDPNVILAEGYGAAEMRAGSSYYLRFGVGNNAYYLNETYVLGTDFTSIDEFLNTKVMDYIITNLGVDFSTLVKDANEDGAVFTRDSLDLYTYNSKESDDALNWTAFDFILKYIEGRVDGLTEATYIYSLSGTRDKFVLIGSNYVNITKLGCSSNSSQHTITSTENTVIDSSIISNVSGTPTYVGESIQDEKAENSKLFFSEYFDPSDYTTWTIYDFIIYYEYSKGNTGYDNFQSIIFDGFLNCGEENYVSYTTVDEFGSTKSYRVLKFGEDYLNYNVLMQLYYRTIRNLERISSGNGVGELNVDYNGANRPTYNLSNSTQTDFTYIVEEVINSRDFTFNNFYYFDITDTATNFYEELGINVTSQVREQLQKMSASVENVGQVNFKLSSGFDVSNVSTWSIIDFIVMLEFSDSIDNQANIYYGHSFNDILSQENYQTIWKYQNNLYVDINGNYYKLTKYIKVNEDNENLYEFNGTNANVQRYITNVLLRNSSSNFRYDFKILAEAIDYRINLASDANINIRFDSSTKEGTICLEDPNDSNKRTFYTINKNVQDVFTIDTDAFVEYSHNVIIRSVNWPQKLMNDMMVIYPDLNWETLIATSGWLDTLGDFTSSYASGGFIAEENSANITAAGMVLSEFFLSVSKGVEDSYANFEYSPIFDEETIKSLMLSMLGEYNYKQLVEQANIFTELFNVAFAPILDKIASKNSIEISDGKVDSLVLSVYKAYLSTVIMSSDYGEYLYKLATRVYAQYTIYEAMAMASGNYAEYLAYLNGDVDEDGNPVPFTYASFYELLKYENLVFSNDAPTFTFSYRNVYKYFNPSTSDTVEDSTIRSNMNNESQYKTLLDKLIAEYEDVYLRQGSTISESDDRYCFLLEVYYSAVQQITLIQEEEVPDYINLYYDYITGSILRWSDGIDSIDINGASQLIPNYSRYVTNLTLYKISVPVDLVLLYISTAIDFADDSGEVSLGSIVSNLTGFRNATNNTKTLASNYAIIADSFDETPMMGVCKDLGIVSDLSGRMDAILDAIIDISNALVGMDSDPEMYEKVQEFYANMTELTDKFTEICGLISGTTTEEGYKKLTKYTDNQYEQALSRLESVCSALENVVTTQKTIDKIKKASITFTLAQYAENYKTDGYIFTLENSEYALGATINPLRLAEYVYGGSWLSQFGVSPTYTSEEFEGLLSFGKKYDGKDGNIKTEIITGNLLRKFVTRLADYTANLYYLTNLNDLSENVSDDVLMDKYIYDYESTGKRTTLEKLLLEYLIDNESISVDNWIRLIVGDTDPTSFTKASIQTLIRYLNGENVSFSSDADKLSYLKTYIEEVFGNSYSGYYGSAEDGGNNRLHRMFINVMNYILVSEDAETEEVESLNFDNLRFKDLKTMVMKQLVDYTQNESETPQENVSRYLALFRLIGGEFRYYYKDSSSNTRIGRTIYKEFLKFEDSDIVKYVPNPSWDNTTKDLYAVYSSDKLTQNTILELAGLTNRPIEELVNLEYEHLYDKDGNYDEADGDTFVICTYDSMTGKYTPILAASNMKDELDDSYGDYSGYTSSTGVVVTTDYYPKNSFFPIIAKGVLTEKYRPTAIRKVDGNVEFYRTDVTVTTNVDEDAITRIKNYSEMSTINYTKFVGFSTAVKMGANADSQAAFIANSSISNYFSSAVNVYFMQFTRNYEVPIGEFGAISVIDNFSVFYLMHMQDYMLLVMGMATVLPILFKASIGAIQRIFDLIFLTLIGPWPIAMNNLSIEENVKGKNSKSYEKWKNMIAQSLLRVFGYIVALNVYIILIKTISGMTFVSDYTVEKIHSIGGMAFLTKSVLNTIIRYLFIAMASGSIQTLSGIISAIVTADKVDDAFTSPVSGDALKNIKGVIGDVKKTFTNVRDVVNGTALIEAKNAALQTLKSAVPGSAIVSHAIDRGKRINNWRKSKNLKNQLEMAGLGKHIAESAAKEIRSQANAQTAAKHKLKLDSANAFQKRVGGEKFGNPYIETPKKADKKKKDKGGKKKK